VDIEAFWEYTDPGASEARFAQAVKTAEGDARLELLTQLARTFSLRGRFPEAHVLLDDVERQLQGAGPAVHARYLLERGRCFNSAKDPQRARPFFVGAWNLARASQLTGLAVDAAHMVAITHSGTADGVAWNKLGLSIARASSDPKAQALVPAMLNNAAWDLHAMGRYDEALTYFEEAETEWLARGKPLRIQVAKWSVARCLRSMGRFREALAIQQALAAEHLAAGTTDPSVDEELVALREAMK
jgi:tetratricopeptide (TPR) repeat protein